MDKANLQIVKILNHLIALCEDGNQGYKSAAFYVKDPAIESVFTKLSHKRAFYIMQLQQELTKITGTLERSDINTLGFLHRLWMEIQAMLSSGKTETIINICLSGESNVLKAYNEYLKKDVIVGYTRTVMEEQLAAIEKAVIELKTIINKQQ